MKYEGKEISFGRINGNIIHLFLEDGSVKHVNLDALPEGIECLIRPDIGDRPFTLMQRSVNMANNFWRTMVIDNWYGKYCSELKEKLDESFRMYPIKKVIFNPPATIVCWADGTQTVVKTALDDEYDPVTGVVMAYFKKSMGFVYGSVRRTIQKDYYEQMEAKKNKISKEQRKRIKKKAEAAAKRLFKEPLECNCSDDSWDQALRESLEMDKVNMFDGDLK